MTPDAHLAKAKRIMNSMERCRDEDYEMVIEGAMLAGNHYANASLHKLGIRPDDSDIIHTEYLSVAQYKRLGILAGKLLECLEEIESLRAPFVRGCAPCGISAAVKARKFLSELIGAFGQLKPTGLAQIDYLPNSP